MGSILIRKPITFLLLFFSWQLCTGNVAAQEKTIINPQDIVHPVIGKKGMVASQEDLATQAGLEVLKEGGYAIA